MRRDLFGGSGRGRRRGLTMFAVAIAVFVAGLVMTIAVSTLQKSQRTARANATVQQLRDFAQAIQAYTKQRGDWPPGAHAAGQVPAGLESALGPAWSRRTPIGGRYLWAPDALQRGQRYRATIMLWPVSQDPVSADRRLLEEIDRKLDDGDLRAGSFQLGYREQPFFILEP